MGIVKEEARKLIDQLPDQATWDDILYQLYIRKKQKSWRKGIAREEIHL